MIVVRLPADMIKWEPVIRQYIKIGKGVITDQGFQDTVREMRVTFSSDDSFRQFVSNLEDIEVEYVLEK